MNVVTSGPDAIAGSIFSLLKPTGMTIEQTMERTITATNEIARVVP